MKTVKIPEGVKRIEGNAFYKSNLSSVSGYVDTAAQAFAYAHGYVFVPLNAAPNPVKSFSLDTTGIYDFGQRNTYIYLVRTSSSAVPTAVSNNAAAVSVSYLKKTTGGYLFRITRLKQGRAVITTYIGSEGASFTANAGPSVKSDTTMVFSVKKGASYTFKMTVLSASTATPQFTVGNGSVFRTQFVKKSGSDYYFKITATGNSGNETGIYTKIPGESTVRQCIVRIA